MREIENYSYQLQIAGDFWWGDNGKGVIREKQQVLYAANELVKNTNANVEVSFFESTPKTNKVVFKIENILGDFLAIGKIDSSDDAVKRSRTLWCMKNPEIYKTDTFAEFQERFNQIPITDTNFSVIFCEEWYKNAIFLEQKVPSNVCANVENARSIWRSVYKLVCATEGLSKISLNEFNMFCAYKRIKFNYEIYYRKTKLWESTEPLTEKDVIHNNTKGYTPVYLYECKDSLGLVFAIIHYCISNRYYLKKCKLCGKYFIPRKTQENYCLREFSYSNWNGLIKHYKSCKDARESIAKSCKARYQKIENKLYKRKQEWGLLEGDLTKREYEEFTRKASEFMERIKNNPSIENLREYEKYLYIDCGRYDKRYERKARVK